MALLFEVKRTAIVKHTLNILNENEMESSTCSILEQVRNERIEYSYFSVYLPFLLSNKMATVYC